MRMNAIFRALQAGGVLLSQNTLDRAGPTIRPSISDEWGPELVTTPKLIQPLTPRQKALVLEETGAIPVEEVVGADGQNMEGVWASPKMTNVHSIPLRRVLIREDITSPEGLASDVYFPAGSPHEDKLLALGEASWAPVFAMLLALGQPHPANVGLLPRIAFVLSTGSVTTARSIGRKCELTTEPEVALGALVTL